MLFRCRGRRDSDIPRPHHVTRHEDDVAAGENAAYASERRIAEKERANATGTASSHICVCPSPRCCCLACVRGLESEQRRIRLRHSALTLLLGISTYFRLSRKGRRQLTQEMQALWRGAFTAFRGAKWGRYSPIPTPPSLPPSQSPYISSGLSRDPIRSRRGRGETVMGKDDVCE